MKVLLSIKPQYADLIFAGTKKWEFRKSIFKNTGIRTVVVYASSPVQKVVGEFEIETIVNDDIFRLWEQTREFAGINEKFFYEYFSEKQMGYAIKIKSTKRYRKPFSLKEKFKIPPPQSFAYIE